MRCTSINILILILLFSIKLSGQQYDFVKILPGIGIVYNNDSIILQKTTIKELYRTLKIKKNSNPNEIRMILWDGYDSETFEPKSGIEFMRKVKFKTIEFEFTSETDKNNLKLKQIKIKGDKNLKIYTDNGLMIGMYNPQIKETYPLIGKRDYISEDSLTYNLYNYGISFQLEKLDFNSLSLIEISTHLIYK